MVTPDLHTQTDIQSTLLSAIDTLGEAQYKIEIAQTLYTDLMDDHFDKTLKPTHDNQVIFFSQRDVIHNKAVALMEFVMQAYADVTETLASIEAKSEELLHLIHKEEQEK